MKKMQVRENVGKSRNTVFFQCFVAPKGRKVGAEVAGQMRDEKLHALLARNTFASQKWQSTSVSEHFWKLECRKSDAGVARSSFGSENAQNIPFSDDFLTLRSTFGSENVQNTPCSDDFWTLGYGKKCRPLWR